jgi:glycerate kinase
MRDGAPAVIVLAPDSFKGSLDARGVCAAMAIGVRRAGDDVEIRSCPMADGGEGTLDAVLSRGGEWHTQHEVTGASGRHRAARYGVVSTTDGPATIIEIAEIVGLTDADGIAVPVGERSTAGIGELLRGRLDAGARRFMLGVGGSSTNDGGAGMLAALGVRFCDAAGEALAPTPAGLQRLASVDATELDGRLAECSLTLLSDVTNPLCGEHGATTIFGPQKGVRADDIAGLDAVLERYASLVERAVGVRAARAPGSGAAGGLGFALQVLGAVSCSGAEVVAELIGLDQALRGATWAITGEGESDVQTLSGKAPLVVARRARATGVPTTLLSGAVRSAALPALAREFAGCFALPAGPMTLDACIADVATLLADRAEQLARLWRAAR